MLNPTRTIFAVAFLGTPSVLLSQAQPNGQNIETYRFNAAVPVVECSHEGVVAGNATAVQAPTGAQFLFLDERAIGQAGADNNRRVVVLQFLRWNPESPYHAIFNVDEDDQLRGTPTFCVDRMVFQRTAERIYDWGWSSWDLAAGVLLLPIKMRLGGTGRAFDFSRDVTLGTVAGPRWRLSPTRDLHLSALVGAGITAVTLDSASTRGRVTTTTDRAAVTITMGLMVEV